MSEKLDNTVDEWVATWPQNTLSEYERTLIIGNLRGFYSWLRRIEDAKIAPGLRKQINSHLADMNEHELTRLLEFLST